MALKKKYDDSAYRIKISEVHRPMKNSQEFVTKRVILKKINVSFLLFFSSSFSSSLYIERQSCYFLNISRGEKKKKMYISRRVQLFFNLNFFSGNLYIRWEFTLILHSILLLDFRFSEVMGPQIQNLLNRYRYTLNNNNNNNKVGGRVETIQTIALLRKARILRRVLETWGDLLSLKLQSKTISVSWC